MEKSLIARYDTHAREPILRRLPDGRLICLSLTGGESEPENQNVVAFSESHDDGRTWSTPATLFSHSSRGCWCTELFAEKDTVLAMVHTYNADCWYRELSTFVSRYDGTSWSEPESVRGHVNGCSLRQGIRLSNGNLLFPLYWQEVRRGFDFKTPADTPRSERFDSRRYPFVSGVGISADNGNTFTRHGYVAASDTPLWEPNAVETDPGHVLLYCRCDHGYLTLSESFDYGYSWSEPLLSDIPNPNTKFSLLKVRDTVLLVNNFSTTDRTHLEIRKSTDGKRFEKLYDIEEPSARFFYPHIYADDAAETVYIAYENMKEHRLCKLSYTELGIE